MYFECMAKTIHRFFVAPTAIQKERVVISDPDQVHQLTRVLRLHEGDFLMLLDGRGKEYKVKLSSFSKKEITGRVMGRLTNHSEPPVRIRLFQGLPKQPAKFEEVLRHGTEVGVSEFYGLLTEHGQTDELRKRERMETILKESAEQSERGKVPVLGPEIDFKLVLEHGWPSELQADVTMMAHSRTTDRFLPDVIEAMGNPASINLLIGPEGGFSENEVKRAEKLDFKIFSLGPRILRTETAGVAVVSALLLGSFSSTP